MNKIIPCFSSAVALSFFQHKLMQLHPFHEWNVLQTLHAAVTTAQPPGKVSVYLQQKWGKDIGMRLVKNRRFILPGGGGETEVGPQLVLMFQTCDSRATVVNITENNEYIWRFFFFSPMRSSGGKNIFKKITCKKENYGSALHSLDKKMQAPDLIIIKSDIYAKTPKWYLIL